MRDCNDQQRIEQEMEQSFIEEMKKEVEKLRANDFNYFVQSHEKAA